MEGMAGALREKNVLGFGFFCRYGLDLEVQECHVCLLDCSTLQVYGIVPLYSTLLYQLVHIGTSLEGEGERGIRFALIAEYGVGNYSFFFLLWVSEGRCGIRGGCSSPFVAVVFVQLSRA